MSVTNPLEDLFDRSLAELVDPAIAAAADAARATLGPVSEIDPDAPSTWQGTDRKLLSKPPEYRHDRPVRPDELTPAEAAASVVEAANGLYKFENGYPTGCPLCGGRVHQTPSGDDPGQLAPYLICAEHGAVWERAGDSWKIA